MLLAFMIAPIVQLVNIGTQLTEAVAGLDRTKEILSEREEDSEPARTIQLGPITGDVRFVDVGFAYVPDKPVLHGISFEAKPGTVTALVGSSGRASPPSSAWCAASIQRRAARCWWTATTLRR